MDMEDESDDFTISYVICAKMSQGKTPKHW